MLRCFWTTSNEQIKLSQNESRSIKLTGFGFRIKAEKTPTILKSMIEFGFENPKPPWTEMTSFFPCGRGHSLLQRV